MYVYKKPLELLSEYGLKAEDITDVIVTHFHPDHIGCLHEFKHADICIQKYEYEGQKEFFTPDYRVFTFEKEYAFSSDIRIEHIGGHTKGSSVVFAGKFLLCSDEAYYYRNLTEKVRVNNCYSKESSQAFVEKYSRSEWTTLVYHDGGIMPNKVGFHEII